MKRYTKILGCSIPLYPLLGFLLFLGVFSVVIITRADTLIFQVTDLSANRGTSKFIEEIGSATTSTYPTKVDLSFGSANSNIVVYQAQLGWNCSYGGIAGASTGTAATFCSGWANLVMSPTSTSNDLGGSFINNAYATSTYLVATTTVGTPYNGTSMIISVQYGSGGSGILVNAGGSNGGSPFTVLSILGGGLYATDYYNSIAFALYTTPQAPLPATINFVYPTSSVFDYPYFDNYIFNFSHLTSTDQYQVNVVSQIRYQSGSLGPVISNPAYTESGAQLITYGLAASAPILSGEIAGPGVVDSVSTTAYLYDLNGFSIPMNLNNFIVASSSLNFDELNSDYIGGTVNHVLPNYFNATGTAISYVFAATSSISIYVNNSSTNAAFATTCLPPSGAGDIGGGIYWAGCSLANFLFIPPQNVWSGLGNAFTSFENTPLMIGLFTTTANIQAQSAVTVQSNAWVMPTITGINGVTSTITIMPANAEDVPYVSTIAVGGVTFENTLFNLILDACVLGFIYIFLVAASWFIRIIGK